MSHMRGEKLEVNGINIHYEKVGNGSNIVLLLPGVLGTSRTDFNEVLEGGLDQSKFTLIAWDPPGYGFSRPPERNYTRNVYENDADYAYNLMKKLGFNFYSVLGWSDGGKTGVFLASKYPAVIDKLVIWGAVPYSLPQTNRAFAATKNMDFWDPIIKKRFTDVYGDELDVLWNNLLDDMFRVGIANPDYMMIPEHELEKIHCPCLIMHGDKDPMVSIEHVQFLQKHLKDSRLQHFKQASHNLHQTFPKEFHKCVTNFLLFE
ncbi:valacyclovir hydrolase-like protein [Dinothrombium tinctorium]|uniref:Valacyclovir hydrolase-like protein n=1 Tax=Dinothrombium tinctorium TaxID=1965070 RepID=A0A3S3RP05_9ACAR|nr:valacyclovir hydrolase-like protein [Dinothrombium tinctorium]